MIVRVASRMERAISFGVFCRDGPSTRAIIRSMKVSPGWLVILHDDPVREHGRAAGDGAAVATGLADDRSRLTGDRGLVDRRDALDDVSVPGDHLAGLDHDAVAEGEGRRRRPPPRCRRRADGGPWSRSGWAQGLGLSLAAPLGHGLGEVGEERR